MIAAQDRDRYRGQLASAVEAVAFKQGYFLWRGSSPRSIPDRILAALSPEGRRALILILLRESLYEGFYCRGGLLGEEAGSDWLSGAAAAFVLELSRANAGVGSRERGWTCIHREGDTLTIKRAGLTLRANVDDLALAPGADAGPGSPVALRVARELPKVSPGFYFAIGNEEWTEATPRLVRVYWNLMPAGAARLIRETTSRLNGAQIAFRIKTLDDPLAYTRCDAAVLYFQRDDYDAVAPLLFEIHRHLGPFLKTPIPAFTKELAPGLGLAEDPVSGGSFGMSRCQWLAEGLVRAHEAGERKAQACTDIVESYLSEKGVDIQKPYLNPGSVDRYDFPPSRPHLGFPWRHDEGAGYELLPAELLLAASRIGEWLAESAIWIGDRVGWVGPDPSPESRPTERRLRYSALGPDLYSGTSGIALFLAELSAASGDRAMRRLSLGAADHALTRVETGSSAPGLFDGWSGVALVAARLGLSLGEPELLSRARDLVQRLAWQGEPCEPFDLLSGTAGLILSCLILSDVLEDERLRHRAVHLGDSLLETAERDAGTLSWRGLGADRRNLTGLSHGAAGAAYSLLELFHATGEIRFRDAAESAFAYEQKCFSAQRENWPDFSKEPGRRRREPRFPSHWCHGAPGIALSRLRAREILGPGNHEGQARLALATTEREAERRLSSGTGDLSLCHGLAGDAEVLLCGARARATTTPLNLGMPNLIAAAIIHRLGLFGETSPSAGGGLPLGLMTGLAGVGYLLLRLRDERVPSLLMLRREEFSDAVYLERRSNPSTSQTSDS